MPSFNDQVQNLKTAGSSFSIFVEGVKPKYMAGESPILFRLLPAYNFDDRDAAGNINPAGFLPCRLPDGSLSPWGAILWITRSVGHGSGRGSSRRDYVAPATFGGNPFDPVAQLYATAAADNEWQYLVKDQLDPGGRLIERAALSKPGEHLIVNIVELTAGGLPEVALGVMGKSACDALVSPHKNGLLFQRANNVTEDMIRQNYIVQWSCGDVTHPSQGPVLQLQKGKDKGKMSAYQIQLSTDARGVVRRLELGPEILQYRYDLTDISRLLVKRTEEETAQLLIETFTGRSPRGYHEYVLLKQAFGTMFKIPEPPAAPAASATVQSGFGGQPGGFGAQPGNYGQAPVQLNGFGPQPGGGAALPSQTGGFTSPTQANPTPQVAPGIGNAAQAAATAATPPPVTPSSGPAAPGPAAPGDPLEARKAEFLAAMRSRGPVGPART